MLKAFQRLSALALGRRLQAQCKAWQLAEVGNFGLQHKLLLLDHLAGMHRAEVLCGRVPASQTCRCLFSSSSSASRSMASGQRRRSAPPVVQALPQVLSLVFARRRRDGLRTAYPEANGATLNKELRF